MNWHKSQRILHQQNKVKNIDIHNLDDIIDNLNEHNSVPDTPIAEILGKYKQKHAQNPASQFTLFSSNQLLDNSPIIKKPQIALCPQSECLPMFKLYKNNTKTIIKSQLPVEPLNSIPNPKLERIFNLQKIQSSYIHDVPYVKTKVKTRSDPLFQLEQIRTQEKIKIKLAQNLNKKMQEWVNINGSEPKDQGGHLEEK
ncbi:Hypothetical_protein [Hexamita inflata]|uniref:Hypothetical_protein n=1 Tax=Hexamita inflata TaxID=28002 RepID=A0ABP1JXK9_9EUKA